MNEIETNKPKVYNAYKNNKAYNMFVQNGIEIISTNDDELTITRLDIIEKPQSISPIYIEKQMIPKSVNRIQLNKPKSKKRFSLKPPDANESLLRSSKKPMNEIQINKRKSIKPLYDISANSSKRTSLNNKNGSNIS